MSETTTTDVRIEAPLPLDVAGNLLRAVGHMYPNTQIATRAGYALTLLIDDRDRVAAVDTMELVDAERVASEDAGATFDGFVDDSLLVGTPEEASLAFANIAIAMLADPEAVNYMESVCTDADGNKYVVIAARSQEQTPHHLRLAAEARIADAARMLDGISSKMTRHQVDGVIADVKACLAADGA